MFRVVSLENDCDVFQDGKLIASLGAGESYDGILKNEASVIRTTDQAAVFQSMISGECSNSQLGDPSIAMLNSNPQMLQRRMLFCTQSMNGIENHSVSIICKTIDSEKLQLNSKAVAGFTKVPSDEAYSYKIIQLKHGLYELTTEGDGFFACVNGLQDADSNFYSAGAVVNPLSAEQLRSARH